jgi:hypothetical protein
LWVIWSTIPVFAWKLRKIKKNLLGYGVTRQRFEFDTFRIHDYITISTPSGAIAVPRKVITPTVYVQFAFHQYQ